MKKGFTLIELLAVIVILAIIALIATPIVLNIIQESRENANIRSIDLYAKAVENAIVRYQIKENKKAKNYEDIKDYIEYSGAKVECDTIQIKEDSTIYIAACTVNDQIVDYAYGKIKKPCTYVDSEDDTGEAIGTIDLSDVVTCGTESFYVMENDGSNITMLSMYNLNVGDNAYSNGTIGIQNENVFGYKEGYTTYGTVAFSTTNYWWDYDNHEYTVDTNYASEGRSYWYVYGDYKAASGNQQNIVYPYVESYETYLKETLKVNSARATLISSEQLENLNCSIASQYCSNAPSWVYSTSYWTGSACGYIYVWSVSSRGLFVSDYDFDRGVRPVITISTSEVKQ